MELAIKAGRGRELVASLGTLPKGDAAVTNTIAAIQATIDHALFIDPDAPKVRAIAQQLKDNAGGDVLGFAQQLWRWCRANVVFRRDPQDVELIQTPASMVEAIESRGVARGDCDDLATLASTMIAAAGFRPVLVTVGRKRNGSYQHIYFGIRLGDELTVANVLPMDPQENVPVGNWTKRVERVRLWAVNPTEPVRKAK
jgi:hypothetical protein